MERTYFIIAGELSGDTHAARLISELRRRQPQARFTGMGGKQMQQAGCRLVQSIDKMAFMGVFAVLKNLHNIRTNFRIAHEALLQERPDVLILVDYPSFNLKIASFCRRHLPQTKIVYYIPPKIWAWKSWRVHRIARLCDKVLAIFPFETDFYKKYGYTAEYVGNPTKEEISDCAEHLSKCQQTDTIAILPGSRKAEIQKCLPRMLEAARKFPDYKIVVAAARQTDRNLYLKHLREGEQLVEGKTYELVKSARAAVVNTGTAVLETALIGTPQVSAYYITFANPVTAAILKPILFKIPYFTLANLIAGREVVKEMIAEHFSTDNIATELERLLQDNNYRQQMQSDYKIISDILGNGRAAVNAARIIDSL